MVSSVSNHLKYEKQVDQILSGHQFVVTFPGISQRKHEEDGSSLSSFIALNCAKYVFQQENQGLSGRAMLQGLMYHDTFQAILSICSGWSAPAHLNVEDIHKIPIFKHVLKPIWTESHVPRYIHFCAIIQRLVETSPPSSSAALVIARAPKVITVLKIPVNNVPILVTFEHGSGSSRPDGAAFSFSTSKSLTAVHLSQLFPPGTPLASGAGMTRPHSHAELTINADFSAHAYLAQTPLTGRNTAMETSLATLEPAVQSRELCGAQSGLQENSRLLLWGRGRLLGALSASRTGARHSSDGLSHARGHGDTSDSQLEGPFKSERFSSLIELTEHGNLNEKSQCPRYTVEGVTGITVAQSPTITFTCSICMADLSLEYVTRVEICTHAFCRDCAKQYVSLKIKNRRFPILCPVCTINEDRDMVAGTMDRDMLQQLGIEEDLYAIYEEMELSAFSIPLYCRECTNTTFVDKHDYQDKAIIHCPLPDCTHVWCKVCSGTILTGPNEPAHSCDGTSELRHLMGERGWRYCPGCRTPVEKTEGCHHMTCPTAGCNTHFCYACSEQIIKSTSSRKI